MTGAFVSVSSAAALAKLQGQPVLGLGKENR